MVTRHMAGEFSAGAKAQELDRAALSELVRRLGADRSELAEHELMTTLYETAYQSAAVGELLHQDAAGHG